MAIDNTTEICFKNKSTNRAVKHTISDPQPANHDNLEKSTSFAIKQLGVIKYYMSDYVEIIKGCKEEKKENGDVGKEVSRYLNGLNDRNELI
jgi:hypothetical protein